MISDPGSSILNRLLECGQIRECEQECTISVDLLTLTYVYNIGDILENIHTERHRRGPSCIILKGPFHIGSIGAFFPLSWTLNGNVILSSSSWKQFQLPKLAPLPCGIFPLWS